MDANTVTAICATAIASASFVVSVQQARATRRHNRLSVRPVLKIWNVKRPGGTTGMSLGNYGLGPAMIVQSRVWLDGISIGSWGADSMEQVRAELGEPARVVEINRHPYVLAVDDSRFMISFDDYDEERHGDLWSLITNRLAAEFVYESVYGGESYRVAYRMETIADASR